MLTFPRRGVPGRGVLQHPACHSQLLQLTACDRVVSTLTVYEESGKFIAQHACDCRQLYVRALASPVQRQVRWVELQLRTPAQDARSGRASSGMLATA